MIRSKTVFVLGAGASKEVGLPIGSELKEIISRKLNITYEQSRKPQVMGDTSIYHALENECGKELDEYIYACWQIRDGIILSNSIDDFIEIHKHDPRIATCGKIAIARSILEAERKSKLYFERENPRDTIDFRAIANTWYTQFYQLLTKQVPKTQIENIFKNVTIVSFNYDRCLEHFLVHALSANYFISIEAARFIAQKLPIFHPYGTVGPYFERKYADVEFGYNRIRSASEIVSNLKTYTEQIEEGEELRKIRLAISEAHSIVFLGLAFHPTNMAMLVPPNKTKHTNKRFYATRKGISDSDLLDVCGEIRKLEGKNIEYIGIPDNMFFASECRNLFEEYQRSLAR